MLLKYLGDPAFAAILFLLFVVSISLHEFGHAFVADRLGDPTPRQAGRVTLNPLMHLELMGTLMIILSPIGWAKPVPVSTHNFKNPRFGSLLVSLAGPFMNFVLAIVAVAVLKYGPDLEPGQAIWLQTLFMLNLVLMVFNLLPIPPLDGGHVLESVLPRRWLPAYRHLMPYGVVLILVMVFLPGANGPLHWLLNSVEGLMFTLI